MLQARRLGRELVVGVHSDEEIMDNKGPTVMTLVERLVLLAAVSVGLAEVAAQHRRRQCVSMGYQVYSLRTVRHLLAMDLPLWLSIRCARRRYHIRC